MTVSVTLKRDGTVLESSKRGSDGKKVTVSPHDIKHKIDCKTHEINEDGFYDGDAYGFMFDGLLTHDFIIVISCEDQAEVDEHNNKRFILREFQLYNYIYRKQYGQFQIFAQKIGFDNHSLSNISSILQHSADRATVSRC